MRYALACRVAGCLNETDGYSAVCEDCWMRRHSLRRDLPELWLRLHGTLGKGSQGLAEGLSRPRPGSRPPLQVHTLDTLAMVVRRLVGWADACLGEDGPLETARRRQGNILTEAIAVLDRCDDVLRRSPAAHRYVDALARLHQRMTLLVGLEPTKTRLAAPCSACGQTIVPLYRDAERQTVTCTICGGITPDAVWIGVLLTDATGPDRAPSR